MLPEVLLEIIDEYVAEFSVLESLPEIKAIRTLVIKSNNALTRIATRVIRIPVAVLMEIIFRDDFDVPYVTEIQINQQLIDDFNKVLMYAMVGNFATSSLFWLMIQRDPSLYHGPYAVLFENSLLFKLINLVTSV